MSGIGWFPENPLLKAKLEKRTCVTAIKVLPEMLNFRHNIKTTRESFVKLISIPAAALNILLFLPTTVAAQSVVQAGSNISFPARFDGMTVEASNGAWGDLASSYIYRNGGDRIEVIVYRPSYPSVSLWFMQGERRTKELFSRVPITPAGSPEIFAAKSRNSNGMRRFYTIGAPFASTSIAVVGFGQWIVSIRSSSKTLTSINSEPVSTKLSSRLWCHLPWLKAATRSFRSQIASVRANCPSHQRANRRWQI
jgi:hypothetical protein